MCWNPRVSKVKIIKSNNLFVCLFFRGVSPSSLKLIMNMAESGGSLL